MALLTMVPFTVVGCGDDASMMDAGGADGGRDAGRVDGGMVDGGMLDGGGLDAAGPDGSLDDGGSGDGGAPNACKAVDGICLGDSASCTGGGGTLAPGGDSGCAFDDGAGFCCVPPEPQPSGDTCASRGGLCAPISGCNFVDGAFAPSSDCTGVPIVCCVPETICGPEDVVCCTAGSGADFRPECDRGTFTCDAFSGTVLTPIDDCV
jgi:hypothetical protein